MVTKADRALEALAAQPAAGALDKRLEAAVDSTTDAAITAVAQELAGTKNPRMFRSKAARLLIQKGAAAMLAERAARA